MLAAAALIAVVSLITFGVLLDGLHSQSASAVKARAANDSVTQAGVLERIALDVARGDAAGARPSCRAAQRKLLDLQQDDRSRARAEALNRELTRLRGGAQPSRR